MEAKDIILTENDYKFNNGDFVISESDTQHIQDLIFENVGAYKQFPLVGIGIRNYLNSTGQKLILSRNIQIQLQADGYLVNDVKFNNNEISDFTIDANRS